MDTPRLTTGRVALAASAAIAGILAGALVLSLRPDVPEASNSTGESPTDRRLVIDFPNPLGNGIEISALEAANLIEPCPACIALPAQGPASVAEVKAAWHRSGDRAVAIDFEDGLRLYVFPDDRSGPEWAREVVAADGEDLAGELGMKLIELRNTFGVGIDSSAAGSAALSWIEDGLMIEMLGKGGQSLETLVQIAESFGGRDTQV